MPRSMVGQVVERFVNRSFKRPKLHEFSDSWPDEPTEVDPVKTMAELIIDDLDREDLVGS